MWNDRGDGDTHDGAGDTPGTTWTTGEARPHAPDRRRPRADMAAGTGPVGTTDDRTHRPLHPACVHVAAHPHSVLLLRLPPPSPLCVVHPPHYAVPRLPPFRTRSINYKIQNYRWRRNCAASLPRALVTTVWVNKYSRRVGVVCAFLAPQNLRRAGRASSPSRSQCGASGCSTLVYDHLQRTYEQRLRRTRQRVENDAHDWARICEGTNPRAAEITSQAGHAQRRDSIVAEDASQRTHLGSNVNQYASYTECSKFPIKNSYSKIYRFIYSEPKGFQRVV
eukprot:COSAG02_NODE_3965_length_5977_cov_9.580810_1_plen_279_part_00